MLNIFFLLVKWCVITIFNYFIINLIYYWFHRFLHNPKSGLLYKIHYLGHHKKDFPLKNIRKISYSNNGSNGWFNTGGEIVFGLPILFLLFTINYLTTIEYFINFTIILSFVVIIGETCHSSFHLYKNAISHPESLTIHKLIVNSNWYYKYMQLHDIHHGKTNYNFGFIDMTMDKLFGTYCKTTPHYFSTLKIYNIPETQANNIITN